MGVFSTYIGIQNAFYVEIVAAMVVIETTHARGWLYLWLECNSKLVLHALSNEEIAP
uniref:RNase H type-1 domain-containing protein n=1 Tax=Cajanus cajan TaxID=3821 RepID=A0A151SM56_CAJCA|nr:hypothetical protein KK1_002064 [Cajanus cajan]